MTDKTEASGFDRCKSCNSPLSQKYSTPDDVWYQQCDNGECFNKTMCGAYQAGLNSRGSEAVDIVHIAKKFIDGDESLQGLEMALDDYFDTDINNEE